MTNAELAAYIRDALNGPKPYPWWSYFQPAIMAEIAERLECLDAELLSSRGERVEPRSELSEPETMSNEKIHPRAS